MCTQGKLMLASAFLAFSNLRYVKLHYCGDTSETNSVLAAITRCHITTNLNKLLRVSVVYTPVQLICVFIPGYL